MLKGPYLLHHRRFVIQKITMELYFCDTGNYTPADSDITVLPIGVLFTNMLKPMHQTGAYYHTFLLKSCMTLCYQSLNREKYSWTQGFGLQRP